MYEQLDVGGDEEILDGTEECVDDALEHIILDRMMEEWVDDVDGLKFEFDNEQKDECVCMVQCKGLEDTNACRMKNEQSDECVCTVQCKGHTNNIVNKEGGFVTGVTGGMGDDGQNESWSE